MAKVEIDELVAFIGGVRANNPEPVTFRFLLNEVRAQFGYRPSRADFKDVLRRAFADAPTWVTDLDAAPTVSAAQDVLINWVTRSGERGALQATLVACLDKELADRPDTPLVQVARAVGAVDGAVEWSAVAYDVLPKELQSAVLDAALGDAVYGFVLDSLCCSRATLTNAQRAAITKDAAAVLVSEIAERLHDWSKRVETDPSYGEALARLVQISTSTKSRDLSRPLLEAVSATVKSPPKWLESAIGHVVAVDVTLDRTLEMLEKDDVDRVLVAINTLPADPGGARSALLIATARTRHSDLLSKSPMWKGIGVDGIGELTGRPDVGELLMAVAGESVFRGVVDREAATAPAWRVLAIAGRWPQLAGYVPLESLRVASARSDHSAVMLRQFVSMSVSEERAQNGDLRQELADLRAEIDRLRAAGAELNDTVSRREREIEDLGQRLALVTSNKSIALAAEINQGRLDVLRALASLAENVRTLTSVTENPHRVISTILSDAIRSLEGFGVAIEGAVGERRAANPAIDDGISGDCLVEVLTPAYLIGEPATPLRRALVHPVEGAGHHG